MKLANILDKIDSGGMLLPEFQRGYVWNRDQVRSLMRSLYRGYPVGSLLIWETETTPGDVAVRGSVPDSAGSKLLLLDGQQRITSLYGVIRGRAPAFFEGDENAFKGLRFNVADETFEFYAPVSMGNDPRWVDVTKLFTEGVEAAFEPLQSGEYPRTDHFVFMKRLAKLEALVNHDFHDERLTGSPMTIGVVVDIFNRVNSGGTKLSTGDLALARICADWPEARGVMRGKLQQWDEAGFDKFNLDWLLRNINAVATGRAPFAAVESVTPQQFRRSLNETATHIETFLNAVTGRLGLDHSRVLLGHYAFPVASRFLHLNGGNFSDAAERDRMLFWYVHSGLWGRFTGSTETVLARDYDMLEKSGIDGLIESLERWRGGNLTLDGRDFEGSTTGSRFYPMLYMLTRVEGSRDFGSAGLRLQGGQQLHYVFPKALLNKRGYGRDEVNAIANFCFLNSDTSHDLKGRSPADYLAEVRGAHPEALRSQWIPDDEALWQADRYLDFLAARRKLLAAAANSFLTELRTGAVAEQALTRASAPDEAEMIDSTTTQVVALADEIGAAGFNRPAMPYEISDPDTGDPIAVVDACWPDGLQTGLGEPVVLVLAPGFGEPGRLDELGFRVFTSIPAMRAYVARLRSDDAG